MRTLKINVVVFLLTFAFFLAGWAVGCAHVQHEAKHQACQETCEYGGSPWHRWTPEDGCECIDHKGRTWTVGWKE